MSDEDKDSYVAITAVEHNSHGTITWMDKRNRKYVSANSIPDTPLLEVPGYGSAGLLKHLDTSYYLQTSCSQQGCCAGRCRCMDCRNCQQGATGEDIDTEAWYNNVSDLAHAAKNAAASAKAAAAKAGAAAKKGIAAASAAAKKSVEAAKAGMEAYKKRRAEQNEADVNNGTKEHINNGTKEHINNGTKEDQEQLQKCIQDANKALADLQEMQKNPHVSAEEQQRLAQLVEQLQNTVSVVGTFLVHS
jgi:hypothetical protein